MYTIGRRFGPNMELSRSEIGREVLELEEAQGWGRKEGTEKITFQSTINGYVIVCIKPYNKPMVT